MNTDKHGLRQMQKIEDFCELIVWCRAKEAKEKIIFISEAMGEVRPDAGMTND
jgi:hypothetical protein